MVMDRDRGWFPQRRDRHLVRAGRVPLSGSLLKERRHPHATTTTGRPFLTPFYGLASGAGGARIRTMTSSEACEPGESVTVKVTVYSPTGNEIFATESVLKTVTIGSPVVGD